MRLQQHLQDASALGAVWEHWHAWYVETISKQLAETELELRLYLGTATATQHENGETSAPILQSNNMTAVSSIDDDGGPRQNEYI